MIDRKTADLIKERADIVEVVSDYVHLVKRGANYMGLCPFHNERTPSFSVNKRKNFCYCFSCHKGGSPVNFLMEKENVSYHEALLMLAKKYGITVEERELSEEDIQRQSRREALIIANKWAMSKMESYLNETEEGRAVGLTYFEHRGVTDEARIAFHLGYSPEKAWTLCDDARREGQNMEALTTLGLIGHRQKDNRTYDRFHGRVIFPIFNTSGMVVAFGGRDIKGESPAKYINSTESEVYNKSAELYGLFQGKDAIRRQDHIYLVEGYMDVVGMWQSGLQNVVASSGTALTDGQIALIHRFTDNATIIYDGDPAGIKATLRAIDMMLAHRMNVRMLLLPDNHDPDSFARTRSADEFRAYVEEHSIDFIDYKMKVMLAPGETDPMKRSAVIRSIIETIACIPDVIQRNEYVKNCAHRLEIDADTVKVETEATVARKIRSEQNRQVSRQMATETTQAPQNGVRQISQGNVAQMMSTQFVQQRTAEGCKPANPIPGLEQELLRYAIKYGMVDFADGVDAEGNVITLNVAQYISSELEADSTPFSNERHRGLLNTILGMIEAYRSDSEQMLMSVDERAEKMRKEEYDRIVAEGLDSEAIATAEAKLKEDIEDLYREEIKEYACDYISSRLASDPDDFVRTLTTRLIMPRYELSQIYRRNGYTTTEYDRLIELVPRAIAEYKTALLEERINQIRERIAVAVSSADETAILDLQQQLSQLFELRRQAVLAIGDRILNPRC